MVEGRDDTVKIKRAVDADTLETNGSAINKDTIDRIRLAQEKRGVIIFTDPDYPGERIRKIISEAVPGCKHAFIHKKEAIAKSGKGLGVEHASIEVIRQALEEVKQEIEEFEGEVDFQDLVNAGLIGGPKSKERRERLGAILKIGYTNGKQLHKRLQMFQISKETFDSVLTEVLQGEN